MFNIEFWFAIIVMFGYGFVHSKIIIPETYPFTTHMQTKCLLSVNASEDYYKVQDFVFTFLETAETDFRKMSDHEKILSCQIAKEILSLLIAKGKTDWASCLTESFEYFGDFVDDALQNFLDFFCEDGNKHVEGYFSKEAKQCRSDIRKPLFDYCLVSLLAKRNKEKKKEINYDLPFNTFIIPGERDELCRKLLNIRPCITDILETHCPHLDYYKQLSGELLAQTIRPCDEYVPYISSPEVVGGTLGEEYVSYKSSPNWALGGIMFIFSVAVSLIAWFCKVNRWYEDSRHRDTSKLLTNSVN